MAFKEIPAREFSLRPFCTLDEEWALVAAGREGDFNAMTVSWGGLGTLWNLPVATVYIRPQRYTLGFIERERHFTVSFFGKRLRDELMYFGSNSGRDGDKLAACPELSVGFGFGGDAPVFDQAGAALICRKLYCGDLRAEGFTDKDVRAGNYPDSDFHRVFIGEVTRVLVRE